MSIILDNTDNSTKPYHIEQVIELEDPAFSTYTRKILRYDIEDDPYTGDYTEFYHLFLDDETRWTIHVDVWEDKQLTLNKEKLQEITITPLGDDQYLAIINDDIEVVFRTHGEKKQFNAIHCFSDGYR